MEKIVGHFYVLQLRFYITGVRYLCQCGFMERAYSLKQREMSFLLLIILPIQRLRHDPFPD
jgi:hypothetical protein